MAFLFGFLNVGIYNGGWINICEYTHGKWKNRLCLILLIADSTTVILSALYFKFISNQWLYFQLFGLLVNVLGLIGAFMLPESPEYLYSFYRFDECREVLEAVNQWNKKGDRVEEYEFDVEVDLKQIKFRNAVADKHEEYRLSVFKGEEHKKQYEIQRSVKASIREFINSEEPLMWNLSMCMIVWAVIIMNYQINDYYDNSYEGDTFDDDIYLTIVELFGFIFGEVIFEFLGNHRFKKIFIGCFLWSQICSIGLVINDPATHPTIDITLDYLCKFAIAAQF